MINLNKNFRCASCKGYNNKHKIDCILVTGIENIDYVKCLMCDFRGKIITAHLKKSHSIDIKQYNGQTIASNCVKRYSISNKGRINWITKLKDTDPILAEIILKNMGEKVSKSILNNKEEIDRRSKLMKDLWENNREYFTEAASATAIETSKRQDILENRTEILRKWRENNPEKIILIGKNLSLHHSIWMEENPEAFAKAMEKSLRYTTSVPQKLLYKLISENKPEFEFKMNQLIYNESFKTKTKKRQVDIFSNKEKIAIEFDGVWHFKDFVKDIKQKKENDKQLNNVLINNGFLVIRISYDQYHPKKGFNLISINKIFDILSNHKKNNSGCVVIGESYNE